MLIFFTSSIYKSKQNICGFFCIFMCVFKQLLEKWIEQQMKAIEGTTAWTKKLEGAQRALKRVQDQMKKVKKEWGTTYTKFNKEFFSNYTSDGVDSICDIMDSLTDSINNDVVITKTSIINFLPESIPFDKRYIIASISRCDFKFDIIEFI